MGCWSNAIMGNDDACDCIWEFHEIVSKFVNIDFNVEVDMEAAHVAFNEAFRNDECMKLMIHLIETKHESYGYYVLGVLMMEHGALIPLELMNEIEYRIDIDIANSVSTEKYSPSYYLKSFKKDLKKYDHKTPTNLTDPGRGLIETMLDKLLG